MGFLSFHTPTSLGYQNVSDINLLGSWETDWNRLTYVPKEKIWVLGSFDNGYEIALCGDEKHPDPQRLAIARIVVPQLAGLMRQVIAYLDAHLDYKQFGSTGQWNLEGIAFGRDGSHRAEVFEVELTTDEYGDWYDCELWFVTCVCVDLSADPAFVVQGQRGGWYGYYLANGRHG
jgi:hypothetical protein